MAASVARYDPYDPWYRQTPSASKVPFAQRRVRGTAVEHRSLSFGGTLADPDREALDGVMPSHCHGGRRFDHRTLPGRSKIVSHAPTADRVPWLNLYPARA
jgi:hypothetical protein